MTVVAFGALMSQSHRFGLGRVELVLFIHIIINKFLNI